MSRTALIVKIPALDDVVALRHRFAMDAANGVPPHITVLVPFLPATQLDESNREALRLAIGNVREFEFALTSTAWFGDHVLWLSPEDPAPFVALTDAVRVAFPEYPPYGGRHDGSVPHATVGDSGTHQQLLDAEKVLAHVLPIRASVTVVTVLVEGNDGSWRELIDIPLGSHT